MKQESPKSEENPELKQLVAALKNESSDSLAMLNDPGNNPVCSITVDESVPCVSVVWKRYATSNQVRYIHESMIHLLKKHRLNKILGDDTELPTIHEDDQKWIVQDWLPRAIDAGYRVAAHKASKSYFGRISVENIKTTLEANVVIRAFDNIAKAREWLCKVEC